MRMDEDRAQLRVLIADENQQRMAEIAAAICALGHTIAARLRSVSDPGGSQTTACAACGEQIGF